MKLFVKLDSGHTEEIYLSEDIKEKLNYAAESIPAKNVISLLLTEAAEGLINPNKDIVHVSNLPKYKVMEDSLLIPRKGYEILSVEEIEDYKYEIVYSNKNDVKSYTITDEVLTYGINDDYNILFVPLQSDTEVCISKEEKKFIGVI